MNNDTILSDAVDKAYYRLTMIAELNVYVMNGYFGLIIPENELHILSKNTEDIIDKVFWKMCNYISSKITNSDMNFIIYRSFSFNSPSKQLIDDCMNIINNILKKKKSSKETTLNNLLSPIIDKYSENESQKTLDTIFDILLDYYLIVKN